MSISGAQLVVKHLEAQKVTHVFGVPGAKIDRVYVRYWILRYRRSYAATNRTPHSSLKVSAG
jgi:hypothetical protein